MAHPNITSGEFNLSFLNLKTDDLLKKSIALYGQSNSGKSVMLTHLLTELKCIECAICWNPGEDQNESFKGIIPKPAIHSDIDEACIKRILDRQDILSSTYVKSRDLKSLRTSVNKMGLKSEIDNIKHIEKLRDKVINQIKYKYPVADQQSKIAIVNKKCDEVLVKAYKNSIIRNYDRAKQIYKSLNSGEKICVKYARMKPPHLLMAFDDCGAIFNNYKNSDWFKKIFKEGRHKHITSIWLCQGVNDLPADWRRGIFINIFCGSESIIPFMDCKGNGFTAKQRKQACSLIETVYQIGESNEGVEKKHYKLLYIRDDPRGKSMYYTKADLHEKFEFGSKQYQRFLKSISKDDSEIDKSNTFYQYVKI